MEKWRKMDKDWKRAFLLDTENALEERLDEGVAKYASDKNGFQGNPFEHLREELLDALVYAAKAEEWAAYLEKAGAPPSNSLGAVALKALRLVEGKPELPECATTERHLKLIQRLTGYFAGNAEGFNMAERLENLSLLIVACLRAWKWVEESSVKLPASAWGIFSVRDRNGSLVYSPLDTTDVILVKAGTRGIYVSLGQVHVGLAGAVSKTWRRQWEATATLETGEVVRSAPSAEGLLAVRSAVGEAERRMAELAALKGERDASDD